MLPQERKAESEKGKEKGNRVTPIELAQYPPKAVALTKLQVQPVATPARTTAVPHEMGAGAHPA